MSVEEAFSQLIEVTGGEVVVAFVKIGSVVKVLADREKMDESAEMIAEIVKETLEKQRIKEAMRCN